MDAWFVGPLLLVLVLMLPLGLVLVTALQPAEYWGHLVNTVLKSYVVNTLLLLGAVGALSILLALPSAWLTATKDFRGRRLLRWMHLLPLAVPTYIAAFSAYEIPQRAIPFLVQLRQAQGVEAYLLAEGLLRYSLLIFLLASVLYPYLFLALHTAFTSQSQSMIDSARSLGKGRWTIFWSISLPLARPAMIAGLALISMEVINDYGAVHFFGVPTLTSGIFRTWFGMNDHVSAVRLAVIAMGIVSLALGLEKWSRQSARFSGTHTATRKRQRVRLSGWRGFGALTLGALPLLGGVVYPIFTLASWALNSWSGMPSRVWLALYHSTILAAGTALLIVLLGLLINFASRLHRGSGFRTAIQLPAMGYAAPGAVIGAGVLMLGQHLQAMSILVLSGSVYAILLGYSLRFFAVAYHPINSGMTQLCGSFDEASRSLGHGPASTLWHIHLPLLRSTLAGVGILVFIDVLKELPLTLILRPAGLETLSTRIFGLASEGRVEDCGAPSLLLILVAMVGIWVGHRIYERRGTIAASDALPAAEL